jgi:toxin-antitoxin system PIN domain toxin
MKPCLADINVLVALLAGNHVHHSLARKWFAGCTKGEIGICRYVQLGVIRLLGSPSVMQSSAISGFAAFRVIHELINLDERVEFIAEHPDIDSFFPQFLSHPWPARQAVNDAYLAAFAFAAKRRLVTFDGGFRNFKNLDVSLLEAS